MGQYSSRFIKKKKKIDKWDSVCWVNPPLGTQSLMHMSGWNGQGVNKRRFSDSWTRDPEELLWYQNLLETLMSLQVRKYTNGGVRGWR